MSHARGLLIHARAAHFFVGESEISTLASRRGEATARGEEGRERDRSGMVLVGRPPPPVRLLGLGSGSTTVIALAKEGEEEESER